MADELLAPTGVDNLQERGLVFLSPFQLIETLSLLPEEWHGQLNTSINDRLKSISDAEYLPQNQEPSADEVLEMERVTRELTLLLQLKAYLVAAHTIGDESLLERVRVLYNFAKEKGIPIQTVYTVQRFFSKAFQPQELPIEQDAIAPQISSTEADKSPSVLLYQRTTPIPITERVKMVVDTIRERAGGQTTVSLNREEFIAATGLTHPDSNTLKKIFSQAQVEMEQIGYRLKSIRPFNTKKGDTTIYLVEPIPQIEPPPEPIDQISRGEDPDQKTGYDLKIFQNSLRVYRRLYKSVRQKDSKPITPERHISPKAVVEVIKVSKLSVDDWKQLGELFSVPYEDNKSYTLAQIAYVVGYLKTPRTKELEPEVQQAAASAFSLMKQWVQKKVEEIKEGRKPKEKQSVESEDDSLEIPEDEPIDDYLDEPEEPTQEPEDEPEEQENIDPPFHVAGEK